jgi:hypothetical protein
MLPYSLTRSLRIDVAFTSIPFSSSSRSATLFSADTLDLAELSDDNELAGFVDEVDAGDLAGLGGGLESEFPKWESLKNKSGKVACFSSPNPDRQLNQLSPANHHKFTTKKRRSPTRFCQNTQ